MVSVNSGAGDPPGLCGQNSHLKKSGLTPSGRTGWGSLGTFERRQNRDFSHDFYSTIPSIKPARSGSKCPGPTTFRGRRSRPVLGLFSLETAPVALCGALTIS